MIPAGIRIMEWAKTVIVYIQLLQAPIGKVEINGIDLLDTLVHKYPNNHHDTKNVVLMVPDGLGGNILP